MQSVCVDILTSIIEFDKYKYAAKSYFISKHLSMISFVHFLPCDQCDYACAEGAYNTLSNPIGLMFYSTLNKNTEKCRDHFDLHARNAKMLRKKNRSFFISRPNE